MLVVEDEPRVCEMIERALRREHEVIAVSCGRAALDQVAGGTWFDVIISDVMMPNMTGVQLLETLLQVAPAQARRLVFLSGGVFTADTRARLDELGTIQLEKPISGHELRSAVRRVAAASAARNAA